MASWTDKPQSFNPYVQQLPVDAMVKVGMQKQQQYDQGVEKIQANIDNVAGISLLRDNDKQYLQSKLNSLTTNLRGIAAGDFSNSQLTNSVMGMTNQIVKDRVIQAGMQSSAFDKKQLDLLEAEEKKGNGNPANTDKYYRNRQAYINSELTTPDGKPVVFNDSYKPFFDIDKFTRESFAPLKEEGFNIDQIYQTDEQGNKLVEVVTDARTGQKSKRYILSETMSKLKKEGMFPERVSQVLDHIFSDPRVTQQLQISGEYEYKNVTPEMLAKRIIETKTQQLELFDDGLANLNLKKSTTKDPEEQKLIQEQIDKVTENKTKVITRFDDLIKASGENPDYIRGLLYKEAEKESYQGMYTSVKEERLVLDNPAMKHKIKMQEMADANTRHREDMSFKYAESRKRSEEFQQKLNADIKIAQIKAGEGGINGEAPTQDAVEANIEYLDLMDESFNEAAITYGEVTDELLFTSGVLKSDAVNEWMAKRPGLSLAEARRQVVNSTAKSKGKSPEEYRAIWFEKAIKQLNSRPGELPVVMQDLKTSAENAQASYRKELDIKSQVDKLAPDIDLRKDLETFTISTSKGNINLTPQLQYQIALAFKGSDFWRGKSFKEKASIAEKRLLEKGIDAKLALEIAQSITLPNKGGGLESWSTQKQSPAEAKFSDFIFNITDSNNVETIEKRATAAKNLYVLNPRLRKSMITGEAKIDKPIMDKVRNLVGNYQTAGQNLSPGFVSNAAAMMKIALDDKNGSFEIKASKDENTGLVTPKIVFYDADAKPAGEMTISSDEALTLGEDVYEWFKRPEVKAAEMRVNVIGNNTTAVGSVNDMSTYESNDVVYNKSDFPNLQNIQQDVKGNIEIRTSINKLGKKETSYFNHLYVNNDGKKYHKVFKQKRSNMDEALQVFDQLTPDMIQQLLLEQKPQQ